MQTLIQDDKVLILASYDEREIIKSMGDYKWNKKRKVWEFPLWKLPKLATYFKLEMDAKTEEELLYQQSLNSDRAEQLEAAQQIKIDHSSGKKLSTLSDNSTSPFRVPNTSLTKFSSSPKSISTSSTVNL